MPRWMHERKNEHYYQKAKQEGYRSRASYKLKQLNEEYHFLKNAKKILDLGAAPGGWLQVASEELNGEGLVLGVDLKEIEPLDSDNVETIQGDATDPEVQREILNRFDGKADLILSDIAPNVSGIWEIDDLRQIHLTRIALAIADKLLRIDGWMVVKVFMGPEHESFIQDMRNMFEKVFIVKPKASRKSSAEIYIVAKNLKTNRVLPLEPAQQNEEIILDGEDEEPIPGDQLPIYEEKKTVKPVY
jgi:23S rRNA (uridine2552-2'-O)-methyltransferase